MHTINVGELAEQVDQLPTERKAVKRRDGIHIDLEEIGYHKLLGSGQISRPLIIRTVSHSGIALARIENAKGRILETEGEEHRKHSDHPGFSVQLQPFSYPSFGFPCDFINRSFWL